jgi:hypothetical protein
MRGGGGDAGGGRNQAYALVGCMYMGANALCPATRESFVPLNAPMLNELRGHEKKRSIEAMPKGKRISPRG